jgi:basic membrane lipoprotein Med (substrate-binding protein (PBP1-ABC) superfamily)
VSVSWTQMLNQIADGTFKGGMFVAGMKEGGTDIAPFHGLVTDEMAAKVQAVRKQIVDGSFTVPVFSKLPTVADIDAAPKPKFP